MNVNTCNKDQFAGKYDPNWGKQEVVVFLGIVQGGYCVMSAYEQSAHGNVTHGISAIEAMYGCQLEKICPFQSPLITCS